MIDYNKAGRRDTVRALLVDINDLESEIGELSGFIGGSLSWSHYSTNKASGEISVTDASAIGNALVRVVCDMEQGGKTERATLGTYFATYGSRVDLNGAVTANVELQSTLTRVSGDKAEGSGSYKSGTWGISNVTDILDYCMEPYIDESAIPATTKPRCAKSYDAGDAKSTICNEMLSSLGAASLNVNPNGYAVISKYVAPSLKPVKWVFDEESAMVVPGITIEGKSVPNKIVAVCDNDGGKMSACMVLGNDSPFSAASVGRYVTEAYSCEAESQADLEYRAARYLAEVATASETVTITHLYAPIHAGDVVQLSHEGVDGIYIVKNIEMELIPGLPCKTTLARIRDVEVENG